MEPEQTFPNQAEKPPSRSLVLFRKLIQSGRPLIYLCSPEDARARQVVQEAARMFLPTEAPVWTWSVTSGLLGPEGIPAAGEPVGARGVLDFIVEYTGPAIFHLKD